MFSKADAEKYFIAEKSESLLFVIIGVAAITAAAVFFFGLKTPFWKGAAIPLLAIGILQVTVGWTVYKRSDAQRIDIVYKMDMDPSAIRNKEIPRMETVMKNFVTLRWVEIALLVAGLVLVFMYRNDAAKTFWYGVGLALALQATVMLAADYFAESRGKVYLAGIKSVV
ncbi:MAG: hypothetical protein V4722_08325 [Bacteroidota bacterium]